MPDGEAPLDCICIPTYNAGATLAETLASVVAQSHQRLDILIVDNASTDDTVAVARNFDDPRIRIHENAENIGAEGNFNRCIALAGGDYTAIFHADDVYLPEMVAEQVAFLERHPAAGGVLTEAVVIDEQGAETGAISLPVELRTAGGAGLGFPELFRAVLRHSNFMICPSAMVRTAVYKNDIRRWRGELFGSSADLDIWFRIALRSQIGVLPMKLMKYRVGDAQFSSSVRRQTAQADFFRVMDYYLARDEGRAAVTAADLENYRKLLRRDTAMRAANLFLNGEFQQSASLLNELRSSDVLRGAMDDKRSLMVFLLLFYLKVMNRPGLRGCGRRPLRYLKQALGK